VSDADAQDQDQSRRDISVGDRVRVVRMPTCELPEETMALYRHLIESGVVLTVYPFVKPPDRPCIHYAWVKADGEVEMCDLDLESDAWVRTDDHATPSALVTLRNIHVGDEVRLVNVPDDEGCYDEKEEALYRRLIREKTLLTVSWIDTYEGETIVLSWVTENGETASLYMDMADRSWERVDGPA